jgi:hypothetical protein
MSKLISRLLIVLAFGWTGSAGAAMLPPITVNGLEWLQPVDFENLSWNQMASVCNATTGVCNGTLGGNDITGWTWAGVADINALFNYYIGSIQLGPGPDGYQSFTVHWLQDMLDDGFMLTDDSFLSLTISIKGILRSTNAAGNAIVAASGEGVTVGPLTASYDYATSNGNIPINNTDVEIGGWFFKVPDPVITVPLTDTLALVGLGLCALSLTSRKRALYT